jgi:hypothetical protein
LSGRQCPICRKDLHKNVDFKIALFPAEIQGPVRSYVDAFGEDSRELDKRVDKFLKKYRKDIRTRCYGSETNKLIWGSELRK